MLKLIAQHSQKEIDEHKEDIELDKLRSLRWPISCRYCGRKGDLNLDEFVEHEDNCTRY